MLALCVVIVCVGVLIGQNPCLLGVAPLSARLLDVSIIPEDDLSLGLCGGHSGFVIYFFGV